MKTDYATALQIRASLPRRCGSELHTQAVNCQALTGGLRVSAIAFAFRLRLGDCGRGIIKMRILGIVALGAALVGRVVS